MKRSMRQPQLGMTFIGILCILALVGVIGYAGIRLVPVYLNYMKVARTMEITATEFKGENPDVGALRRTLEKHWIVKNENGVLMHLAYDDSVPYIANVSLSVHFDKTVKVQ
jgi:hypothetical protein